MKWNHMPTPQRDHFPSFNECILLNNISFLTLFISSWLLLELWLPEIVIENAAYIQTNMWETMNAHCGIHLEMLVQLVLVIKVTLLYSYSVWIDLLVLHYSNFLCEFENFKKYERKAFW